MQEHKYVLAMYDIRGKQNFIFRKGKIQEVIGGSAVIRDLFQDYLYPAASSYGRGIFQYKQSIAKNADQMQGIDVTAAQRTSFSWESFSAHLAEGYIGEVIYDGGGNFFVLYKDVATCQSINRRFTRDIMAAIYSLKVLCSYVPVDPAQNNYKEDRRRLYQKNRGNEANESISIPSTVLPFTQVDRETSMPLVGTIRGQNYAAQQVTAESCAKLKKYQADREKESREETARNELILDKLVEEKGTSSLLAIIHIDGNNMGALFENALDGLTTYEDCVNELRRLSAAVEDVHITSRNRDIDALLEELNQNENDRKKKHRRAVVSAGDDFTIICKAQDALKVTEEYLGKLWEDRREDITDQDGTPRQWSACAGIAVFHSHAPFADAYRIAEECCDNAKAIMKKEKLSNAELIDFEYLQSGIDMSLDKIRGIQKAAGPGNKRISSRPWIFRADRQSCERLLHSPNAPYAWYDGTSLKAFSREKSSVPADNAERPETQSLAEKAEYPNTPSATKNAERLHTSSIAENAEYLNIPSVIEGFGRIGRSNIKGLASAALNGVSAFRLELERIAAHANKETEGYALKILADYKQCLALGHEEAYRALIYDYVIFHDIWFDQQDAVLEENAPGNTPADSASSHVL